MVLTSRIFIALQDPVLCLVLLCTMRWHGNPARSLDSVPHCGSSKRRVCTLLLPVTPFIGGVIASERSFAKFFELTAVDLRSQPQTEGQMQKLASALILRLNIERARVV